MAGALSRRGDIVTVVLPGDYGKPRPAVIVRSDTFDALPSVSVCPLSTKMRDDIQMLRPSVQPSPANGLRLTSQILVDKVTTIPISRIGQQVGRLEDPAMVRLTRALAVYLGIV